MTVDPQLSVVTRSSPLGAVAAATCGPFSGWLISPPARCQSGSPGASKTEDITIALETSLTGQGGTLLGILSDPGGESVARTLPPPRTSLRQTWGQGHAFTLVVLSAPGASWSASGCARACGPAMKRIDEIYGVGQCGKLRPFIPRSRLWLLFSHPWRYLSCRVCPARTNPRSKALGVGSRAALAPGGRLC